MPHDGRLYTVERALRLGASVGAVAEASGLDRWFLDEIAGLVELRAEILAAPVLDESLLRRAKRAGLSDRQLAALRPEFAGEDGVRTLRHRLGVRPVYKTVDTCAAEFAADTPYHYSSYDEETEVEPSNRPKVLILGSGPNRIGQGIEFDYSCVHAVQALRTAQGRTRRSWSTATRRRSRPTTTPPTGSTSNRSRSRTCWRSGTPSTPRAATPVARAWSG